MKYHFSAQAYHYVGNKYCHFTVVNGIYFYCNSSDVLIVAKNGIFFPLIKILLRYHSKGSKDR